MTYLTKDQFGVELFQAIQTCAEAEQIQETKTIALAKGLAREVTRLDKLYQTKKADAVKLVNACPCSDAEAARLLKRFPWVMS